MTDEQFDNEERWLREQFSASLPAIADQGFSEKVVRRIRKRTLLRNGLPLAAVLVGTGVIAWPAVALLGDLFQQVAVINQLDWQAVFEANKTLVIGLILGALSPLAIALLED